MDIGQFRQQFPMKIHVDNFLKLHDSLTVVSVHIADTMPPILTSATVSVWVAVIVGIECPVIFGFYRPVDWCLEKNCLENVSCHSRADGFGLWRPTIFERQCVTGWKILRRQNPAIKREWNTNVANVPKSKRFWGPSSDWLGSLGSRWKWTHSYDRY